MTKAYCVGQLRGGGPTFMLQKDSCLCMLYIPLQTAYDNVNVVTTFRVFYFFPLMDSLSKRIIIYYAA